jgi:spermidine/putrescine transport system ATP-binding protein
VLRPSVLLLDEPLGALDAKLRRTLQVELGALQKQVGITFLYVTHDQEEALTMSDRLAVMNHGRIAHLGTPEEVYNEPADAYVADFLGVSNLMDAEVEPGGNGDRACRVRLGDFVLDAEAGRINARGPVKLAIRPERVNLHPHGSTGPNHMPGMVERVVFLGSTTHVYVRLATGSALQTLIRNDGAALPFSQGTPVSIQLPADALRVLPDSGVSVAEIHDETTGDDLLDVTGTSSN